MGALPVPATEVRITTEQGIRAAYALVMVAVLVGVDVLVFRHDFWERLLSNVGIVLVFGAVYLRFFRSQ